MKHIMLVLAALFALASTSVYAYADVHVIVNSGNGENIDTITIKNIFSGKPTELKPVDNKKLLDKFYRVATGRSSRKALLEWAKIVFKGKGDKPDLLSNDMAVINKVKSDPNAIGYVSSAPSGVKVIHTYK